MAAKNIRPLIFGTAVSLLALFLAFRNADFPTLLESVLSAHPGWVVLALIAYIIHFWLKALRWRDLLSPVCQVGTSEVYPVMMTGFFANNILPAHLGEFVRMYVGSRVFKVRKTEVFATIALERLLDFSFVAVMLGGALLNGNTISHHLEYVGMVFIAASVVAWFLITLALLYEKAVIGLAERVFRFLPGKSSSRVTEMMWLLIKALQSLKSMRLVVRSAVFSFLQWLLVGVAIYAALRSIGVQVEFSAAIVTLAATVLAVSLPAAPGFFGTIQLAFVLALTPYGVSENSALASSVVFHLITYLFVMISGVIALQQLNMRFAELKKESHSVQIDG